MGRKKSQQTEELPLSETNSETAPVAPAADEKRVRPGEASEHLSDSAAIGQRITSDHIRQALATLGIDASIGDVESYFAREYPGFVYNKPTLNSTLSQQRKKLREQAGGTAPAPTATTRAAPRQASLPTNSEPGLADLLAVKKLCDAHGGIENLLDRVSELEQIASTVGGFDRLKKCLHVLHDLIIA